MSFKIIRSRLDSCNKVGGIAFMSKPVSSILFGAR